MSRRKDLLLSLLLSIASIAFCLLVAEIVLRFLPVSTSLRSLPVTAEEPVLRFTPNRPFTNSLGWNMHNVVHGRTNNAGFVNDQDYEHDGAPLIAVVGDSFIEAQMVFYAQTVQGRLAADLKGRFRVYSFAASGAPLSQYLIYAEYAVKTYGARGVIINVVGNDFDESLSAYRLAPGFWQYAPDADGVLRLRLDPHRAGTLISLARHSALARYLILNLGIQHKVFAIRGLGELIFGKPANAAPRYAGNTDASVDAKRVQDSLAAIDAFFRDLPERVGLPADRVLITLDGFRYPEAAQIGAGTYFDLMRRAMLEKGRARGYEVVDLDPLFMSRHQQAGTVFDFQDDNHWNAEGHAIAAQAVMASKFLQTLEKQAGP